MHKIRAENFNREAAECRRRAEEAASADKQAWLALAEDWSKPARGQDLIREWQPRMLRGSTVSISRALTKICEDDFGGQKKCG
jgi:hypothetical protein